MHVRECYECNLRCLFTDAHTFLVFTAGNSEFAHVRGRVSRGDAKRGRSGERRAFCMTLCSREVRLKL